VSERLEALSPLGIDPAVRAASLARVRRDERPPKEDRRRPREQDHRGRPEEDEDDGRVHVDVRA
jgi:hypothetical protein